MGVDGLHNVYNLTGIIIAAHEFLNLPYDKILQNIAGFNDVSGRMEEVGKVKGKDIFIDYAHNPAGVETVLKEFKKLLSFLWWITPVRSSSLLQWP